MRGWKDQNETADKSDNASNTWKYIGERKNTYEIGSSNTIKTGHSKITKDNSTKNKGRIYEDITKEAKQFWSKIIERKEHSKNIEWINNI